MLTIYGVIREVLLHYNNPSAYDLLYEIRVQLMEKMAHNLSDVAAGVAAPLFTILYCSLWILACPCDPVADCDFRYPPGHLSETEG